MSNEPQDSRDDFPRLLSRREFLQTTALATAALMTPSLARAANPRRIVSVAIHPAIGIARVGNSEDSFFFGPEVPGVLPRARDGFKDRHGAIAKQAARFRIYGYDANGRVVREITAQEAGITWSVDVANSKAAWYEVNRAFDISGAPPVPRRNANVADRSSLIVQANRRVVRGASAAPQPLDGGIFQGQKISLGEVFTDERGRLVFLPGKGAAYSTSSAPPLGGFADNDGWTDDVCDGPIRATVILDGRRLEAEPAWVVSAIPNYAPGIASGLVTAYDAIYSMERELGRVKARRVDFDTDVMPIFERLVDLQWVNAGFFESNGFGSGQYWTSDRLRRRLANNAPNHRRFRTRVFREFRNPAFTSVQPDLVPQLYGDGTVMPPNSTSPTQWLAVTKHQYRVLDQWAHGRFDVRASHTPRVLEELPIQQQPGTLDRAALEACLGGAFHPGIEFPWIIRVPFLWAQPFRLKLRSLTPDTQNWGTELTAQVALDPQGPLNGCTPGDITRWLGIPWHADGASCRSGYQRHISRVLPAFWPARIPTQVLSEDDYKIVMDTSRPLAERKRAFRRRRDWERFIARPTRPPTLALMVREWFRQGMVVTRPGPTDGQFPSVMKVESYVGYRGEPKVSYPASDWVPQG